MKKELSAADKQLSSEKVTAAALVAEIERELAAVEKRLAESCEVRKGLEF